MSRNPHNPTPELRQHVKSLCAVGLPQEDIAIIIGVSEKTLRLHYRQELDEGAEEANAAVVGFLMDQIDRGNVTAMIFHEKCGGGPRKIIEQRSIEPDARCFDLPCNGIGMCTHRHALYYVPGEETWPVRRP